MDMTQALAPAEAPAGVVPMMPTVPEPLPLMLTNPEPPPLMPVAPALMSTTALSGGPPVQPIVPPLLQMKRGEVLMKPEDARRKKAPKGYNYEPVLPGAHAEPQAPTDGKRVRRATSKAIEGEGGTIPQLGTAPKRQKTNSFGQLPYGYDPPYAEEYGGGYGGYAAYPAAYPASYPSTSGTSGGDVDAKTSKKEEKKRLLEELQRLREVQEKAERKQEKLAVQRANRAAAAAQGGSLYGVDRHLVGAPQPYDTEYAPSTSQLTASGRPQRAAAAAYNGNLYLNNQPDIEYNLDLPRAKRTVKANSLYTSDDLLTGEDIKLPPPELLPDTGPVERRRPERTSAPAGTGRLSPKEAKEQAVAKDRGFRMDRLFNHCCSVLRNVESRNKNAWLFAEPVDGKIILDYHSVVTSPMDFATMKQKVEQKEYDSPLQFVTDARQVFTNCKLYNKPESAEAAMGLDVEHDFERRWMNSKIEEKWEQEMGRREQEEYDISVASDVRPPSPEPSAYAPATMSSMGSTLAKGGSAPKRSAYSHTSTQREMTFDEKRALSTALESLPPEKLGRVVEIIQEANALGDEDKEELELDIDLLEAGTLWKLQRFVASVNTAKVSAPAGDFSDIFAVADTLPQPSFGGSDSSSSSDEEE